MYFNKATFAFAAIFALQALANPVGIPELDARGPKLEARDTQTGFIAAFSKANYGGTQTTLEIVSGATPFCEIWQQQNGATPIAPIKSYAAANIQCATFASKDCSGDVKDVLESGVFNSTSYSLGSIICFYRS